MLKRKLLTALKASVLTVLMLPLLERKQASLKQIEIIYLELGVIMVHGQFLFLISMLISQVTLIHFSKKSLIGRINLKTVVKKLMSVGLILMVTSRKIEMVTFIQLLYLSMFSFNN